MNYTIKYKEDDKVILKEFFLKKMDKYWYICTKLDNEIYYIDIYKRYSVVRQLYLELIEVSRNNDFDPYTFKELIKLKNKDDLTKEDEELIQVIRNMSSR